MKWLWRQQFKCRCLTCYPNRKGDGDDGPGQAAANRGGAGAGASGPNSTISLNAFRNAYLNSARAYANSPFATGANFTGTTTGPLGALPRARARGPILALRGFSIRENVRPIPGIFMPRITDFLLLPRDVRQDWDENHHRHAWIHEYRLGATGIADSIWVPGMNQAECHGVGGHKAPDPSCECGFWAFPIESLFRPRGQVPGQVHALVLGYGTVGQWENGYRFEKAEVHALLSDSPMTNRWRPRGQEVSVLDGLARRYNVPIVTPTQAQRMATEWPNEFEALVE